MINWTHGKARWYEEEFVEAVEDYARLLELDGEEFTVLSSRGQVYVEMNEFEAGLADLDRAIELGRENQSKSYLAYARSGRALALAGLDRFDEAREEFEASIGDCPENAWVHYNHGRVYHKLGEHHKAALCFELSLALEDPRLTPRKRELATTYARKHFEQTLATMREKFGSDHPDTLLAIKSLANAYQKAGQFDKAIDLHKETLESLQKNLGPNHPEALAATINLAITDDGAGRLREAVALYEQAIAEIRKKHGDDDQRALALMNNIAFILATAPASDLRDGRRAVELATEVCERTSYKNSEMLDTLAAAYAETGNFGVAVKWSEKAIELLGSDAAEHVRDQYLRRFEKYKAKEPLRRSLAAYAN